MLTRIEKSIEIYNNALSLSSEGDARGAACRFCDAFYMRSDMYDEKDIEYLPFFRYQFLLYLSAKRRLFLSLAEGDMISDLISSVYSDFKKEMENSPFNLDSMGEWSILSSLELCFPGQSDPILAV